MTIMIYYSINMRVLNREKIEKYSKDTTFIKYIFREVIIHSESDFLNVNIGNNQYLHSTERLTIRKFRSKDFNDNNSRETRFNPSFRIVLYLEGKTQIYNKGKLSPVDSSCLMLQSPGEQISVTPKVASDFTILEYYFDLTDYEKIPSSLSLNEYFNKLFGCSIDNLNEVNKINSVTKDELQNLFAKLYDQLLEDDIPGSSYRINLSIFNIFNRITEVFLPHNNTKQKTGLNSVIRELKQNYNRDYSIEELASLASLSKHYFQNLFKKTYGITPIGYLNKIRINHAKFMLKNYNNSCNEISYNVGFKSPFYFSKVFKKYTGISPTEYRVKSKKN